MANDGNCLGATNGGLCHWYAVVRQALCDPDFIQGLVSFKKKFKNPNAIIDYYDYNLARIMNNTDYFGAVDALTNVLDRIRMFWNITDEQGNLKSEGRFDINGNETFPQIRNIIRNSLHSSVGKFGTDDPEVEYFQISDIMKYFLQNGTMKNYNVHFENVQNNYGKYRDAILASLNQGLPIHVCASPNHHYNVYKDGNEFLVVGCGQVKHYNRLSHAIFSYVGNTYSVFIIPKYEAINLLDGPNNYKIDVKKEIMAYKNFGYKPWEHGHIYVGKDPIPQDKKFMLDYLVQQIKQANYNKQIAWNNFLSYQKFNNWQMMNVCCNNWHYNNNLGIMAFHNACKVVKNNPILKYYYNQKINGRIK